MLEELFDLKPKKYGIYSYLELLPMLLEWKRVKCIVWGSGPKAYVMKNYLEKIYNVEPAFFIEADNDENMTELFSECTIISQEKFHNLERENYFAVIAIHGNVPEYVEPLLKRKGACFVINATAYTWSFKPLWYIYFKKHIDKIEKFYCELFDQRSKEILKAYLKSYIVGDRYDGEVLEEEKKYFGFDWGGERLFALNMEDIWLNIGGAYGDTLYQAAKNNLLFKKIISIEADKESYEQLKYNVSFMPEKYKKIIELVNIFLDDNYSIDQIYADEKISFINMDIEGAELDVLHGAVNTIQKYRPILAISLYHKAEDLVEIPEFIRRNFSNYKLYLRKYPTVYFYYFDGVNQVSETVLYAIPEERAIL